MLRKENCSNLYQPLYHVSLKFIRCNNEHLPPAALIPVEIKKIFLERKRMEGIFGIKETQASSLDQKLVSNNNSLYNLLFPWIHRLVR